MSRRVKRRFDGLDARCRRSWNIDLPDADSSWWTLNSYPVPRVWQCNEASGADGVARGGAVLADWTVAKPTGSDTYRQHTARGQLASNSWDRYALSNGCATTGQGFKWTDLNTAGSFLFLALAAPTVSYTSYECCVFATLGTVGGLSHGIHCFSTATGGKHLINLLHYDSNTLIAYLQKYLEPCSSWQWVGVGWNATTRKCFLSLAGSATYGGAGTSADCGVSEDRKHGPLTRTISGSYNHPCYESWKAVWTGSNAESVMNNFAAFYSAFSSRWNAVQDLTVTGGGLILPSPSGTGYHCCRSAAPQVSSAGLVVAPALSNLLPQSFNLTWSWTLTNVTAAPTAAVSPDGLKDAGSFAETVTDGEHKASCAVTVANDTSYTFTGFIKAPVTWTPGGGTRRDLRIAIPLPVSDDVEINLESLTTGIIGIASSNCQTTTLTDVGSGWYRLDGVFETGGSDAGATTCVIRWKEFGDGANSYPGSTSIYCYWWGMQLASAAINPSDPTYTNGLTPIVESEYVAATASATVYSLADADQLRVINKQGRICISCDAGAIEATPDADSYLWAVYQGASAYLQLKFRYDSGADLYYVRLECNGGSFEVTDALTALASNYRFTVRLYPDGTCSISVGDTDTGDILASGSGTLTGWSGATLSAATKIYLGADKSGANQWFGTIRSIEVW